MVAPTTNVSITKLPRLNRDNTWGVVTSALLDSAKPRIRSIPSAARIAHARNLKRLVGCPLAGDSTVRRRIRLPDLSEFDGPCNRAGKMEKRERRHASENEVLRGKVLVELTSRNGDHGSVGSGEILSVCDK
jgi:hypothetical protein